MQTRMTRLSSAGTSPAPLNTASYSGCSVALAPLRSEHWPAVAEIYAEGIEDGQATFEVAVPSWEEWDGEHLPQRLVAKAAGHVVGWGALAPASDRCAYRGVAWDSVYVHRDARGQGIGRRLLGQLVLDAEEAGIWTLQAGIFPENRASLAVHERCGFRVVGIRERLGRLHGAWRDVLLMERRSARF